MPQTLSANNGQLKELLTLAFVAMTVKSTTAPQFFI